MAQDRLGLFDTPPDREEIRLGLMIVGLLFGILLVILPLRKVQLTEVPAFIPVIDAIMLVGELITATLLFAQAAVFRSRALTILATGFVAAALLLIPHALTFPGAFAPDGLLGAGLTPQHGSPASGEEPFPFPSFFMSWFSGQMRQSAWD